MLTVKLRLLSDKDRKEEIAPELVDAGCELMQQLTFTKKDDHHDFELAEIAQACLGE